MPVADKEMFAVVTPGLEAVTAKEIKALGYEPKVTHGGVEISAAPGDVYRLNLHLRTASRIVLRVAEFRARSFIELERHARRIDWIPYIGKASILDVRATSKKSRLYHERGIAERFSRWIGEATGARTLADGDGEDDAQRILVRFHRDGCTVSIDSSGANLHRRGYRQAVAKAPLRETVAAAMLLEAGWNGDRPLTDPMCGSGTIPIEAALIARGIAPGLAAADRSPRSFAFEGWKDFDRGAWDEVVASAVAEIRSTPSAPIVGSDRDSGGIDAAIANATRAGVEGEIDFSVRPVSALEASAGQGLLLANAPWGLRVGDPRPLRDLYASIGHLARSRLAGWEVGILAAEEELIAQTRLDLEKRIEMINGGIRVGFYLGKVGSRT